MKKGVLREFGLWVLPVLSMGILLTALPVIAEVYDVVILNGRVMDPESNLDSVRNIGISKGTIQAITTEPLQGKLKIEARGLIVSPGFIDIHVHLLRGQDQINFTVKATDGVTTALDLEAGTEDVDRWYAMREGKAIINYGASASHTGARMIVMKDPGPLFPTGDAVKRAATESEIREIKQKIEQGLDRGAIGIGLLLGYIPTATREEILEIFRTANGYKDGSRPWESLTEI